MPGRAVRTQRVCAPSPRYDEIETSTAAAGFFGLRRGLGLGLCGDRLVGGRLIGSVLRSA